MIQVTRRWQSEDEQALRPMLADFLTANVSRGGSILATERNVTTLWRVGLTWAGRGCPCLVAMQDGACVGYCEWGWDDPSMFDLRWKTCFGLGTYVTPEYRGHGLAHMLRTHAREIGESMGVQCFTGPVHLTNPLGVVDLADNGWWPTSVHMELHV